MKMDRIKYQRSLDRDPRQDEFTEEELDYLEREDKDDEYATKYGQENENEKHLQGIYAR